MLPKWSRHGREIFYLKEDDMTMFAVPISGQGEAFRPSRPTRLFSTQMLQVRSYPYDVAPGGQRFLAVVSSGATTAPLKLMVDWPSEVGQ